MEETPFTEEELFADCPDTRPICSLCDQRQEYGCNFSCQSCRRIFCQSHALKMWKFFSGENKSCGANETITPLKCDFCATKQDVANGCRKMTVQQMDVARLTFVCQFIFTTLMGSSFESLANKCEKTVHIIENNQYKTLSTKDLTSNDLSKDTRLKLYDIMAQKYFGKNMTEVIKTFK